MSINTNTHIKHFRPSSLKSSLSEHGVLTTAVRIENGKIMIGWSFCDPRDSFCKKLGRKKAISRLDDSSVNAPLKYAKNQNEINLLVLSALHASGQLPHASKRLVFKMIAYYAVKS